MSDDEGFEVELDGFPTVDDNFRDQGRDPIEVIVSDYLDRMRSGEAPSIDDYAAQYPDLGEEVREFLNLVVSMEEAKRKDEVSTRREVFSKKANFERLGPYKIVREIGRGGMGIVFEAIDDSKRNASPVAIKLLPVPMNEAGHWKELFQREARLARSLKHRNIVPVKQFAQEEDFGYYVMPLVRGVGLDWIIRQLRERDGVVYADEITELWGQNRSSQKPVVSDNASTLGSALAGHRSLRRDAWRKFAVIGLQVCQALRYAHSKGMIHRDIKPANLLLDEAGHTWITDFGLAVMVGTDPDSAMTDEVGGTLRYMAPEQLDGSSDLRTDIYALGITLYELLCQHDAISGKNRSQVIERIINADRVPLDDLRPDVPPELVWIVNKAAHKNADERYQSADQMSGDLLRYLNGLRVPERRGLLRIWDRWRENK